MTPAELTSIESCASELEEVARGIFMDNIKPGFPEDWLGTDADRNDYRLLTEHVAGLRAMVATKGRDADQA